MADQTTSAAVRPGSDDSRTEAELREELACLREENLRLRDLLIGKDVELGAAKGRLAELELQSRYLIAIRTYLSRIPGALRLFDAGLRRLWSRQGQAGG